MIQQGEKIVFGNYAWQVLDKSEDKVLLLLCHALCEPKRFHKPFEDATWENSDLRSWLNETWLYEEFNEHKRSFVCFTPITNNKNKQFDIGHSEDNTVDEVFLLSVEEFMKFKDTIDSTADWW